MLAANQALLFNDLGTRRVQADFSGGTLCCDAGALLLRQVDHNLGLTFPHFQVKFSDGLPAQDVLSAAFPWVPQSSDVGFS